MTPTALPTSPAPLASAVDSASPDLNPERKPDLSLDAAQERRANPDFLARATITSLAERLPLPWPTPPGTPPSPKPRYRSAYQPPTPASLLGLEAPDWTTLSDFDLALRLVDFSGLRPVLASKLYQASALGRVPFDPISLFLLFGWQLVNRWSRLEVLRHLKEPRYADYALAFGFGPGLHPLYPSESGYRYFLTTLGNEPLNDLLVQSMNLVRLADLIPEQVKLAATVSFDGQIHDAASRLRCGDVGQSCYQPTSPDSPRACPASEQGKPGCACDPLACRQVCKLATPRDPEARYVWYAGHNRDDHPVPQSASTPQPTGLSESASTNPHPGSKPRTGIPTGQGRYGYRSLSGQLIDPTWRVNWTLDQAELLPANAREESPAGSLLRQIVGEYDWLHVAWPQPSATLGWATSRS